MPIKRKISDSFWIDSLTKTKYALQEDIPKHIPIERFDYWDSNLEHNCYYRLLKAAPKSTIKRQSEQIILPKTKLFQELSWKIDFELLGEHNYLIECKGSWILKNGEALANFVKLLRFFQMFNNQDFNRLIIVSDKSFKLGHNKIKVHSFDELPELL